MTFAIEPAWPVTVTLYTGEFAMFANAAAVTVGAGGATLFLPIVPVSVVVFPPDVSVIVTVIVPSAKPERSRTAPNVPRAPITPVPESVEVPSLNV